MAALHPAPSVRPDAADRPDTLYALVVGIYVTLLVTPALVGVPATAAGPGVVYVGYVTAATATVVAVTWLVRRSKGLPERIGGSWLQFGFAVLAVPVAGLYLFVLASDGAVPFHDSVAFVGMIGSAGAVGLGLILGSMSRTRYTAAVVDEAGVEAEWTAGWPDRHRRLVVVSGVLLMAVSVLSLLGQFVWDADWLWLPYSASLVGGVTLINVGADRTYRVTRAGLERSNQASRSIYGWDAFDGFEVTDETIVVRWRAVWRPAIRCARDQIDDPDGVTAALDAHLDRR